MPTKYTSEYLKSVAEKYQSGHAREHAYRPALEKLFSDITGLRVINDPKKSEFGAPDFVFLKGRVVMAYAEAKDIGVSLDETEKGEQLTRYFGYSNLILTDCLEFRFFRNGEKYETIKIAEIKGGEIAADENNFAHLEDTVKQFIQDAKEPIKSGKVLAKVMAGKARRIRDNIKKYLNENDEVKNASLISIYGAIKKLLLADLDYEKFADMYAQTVVYGLFVARYHDDTPDNFSRQEARDLVPKSNPFLRKFFDHIAGEDFDERIEFIVKELCEEFVHADVQAIVHDYYKVEKTDSRDPIIHFYEDFLQEYNPAERKKMGVFYTPLPVVRFIVRAVDDVLKKEFGLKGLADSSMTEIKGLQNIKAKRPVHKVQILDPATGTGTFLNEVITHIKKSFAGGQEGRWANYAREDLLPRLHGFEIMMASYTIAHLKLSTTLEESGVDINKGRLGVYLTNSLEKAESYDDTLFAGLGLGQAIADESFAANKIKNDLPIMVVLGNPPYNVSSQNKGEWIGELLKDYKKDLGERKINLDDDYIKFIRFSQYLIDKNGEGIIGMITNNSYIDGITHRQMRKTLLATFDSIYILDLHGNAKKKETAPDGSADQNVFSIMQGVSIAIFVKKTGKKKALGAVYHAEMFGKQKDKYEALDNATMEKTKWKKLDYSEPYYFFVPKDFGAIEEYEKGFKVDGLFINSVSGVESVRDNLTIHFNKTDLEKVIDDFIKLTEKEISIKYNTHDARDWKISRAKEDVIANIENKENFRKISYRPFDSRDIFYTGKQNGFVCNSRFNIMKHMLQDNIALNLTSKNRQNSLGYLFVSKNITDRHLLDTAGDSMSVFPLYLYADDGTKVPNLKKEIVKEVEKITGTVTPENILDYIYAVLHSPSYREKYKEFLKIDFPCVPYPKDEKQFFALVKLGEELRHLHLLESPKVNNFITTYPIADGSLVEKITYQNEKVFINKTQYFGGVPQLAWDFYIGGYQPAQKWLKDRKGRQLSNTDIEHYQKMIVVLVETGRVMKEIDEI